MDTICAKKNAQSIFSRTTRLLIKGSCASAGNACKETSAAEGGQMRYAPAKIDVICHANVISQSQSVRLHPDQSGNSKLPVPPKTTQ
jgi:hypothetical protein